MSPAETLVAGAMDCQVFSLMKSKYSIGACAVRIIVSETCQQLAIADNHDEDEARATRTD